MQPSFGRDATVIQMNVLGRRIEDIDEFMEKLEATGAFHDVLPTQEDTTDEGMHRLMVRSTYTGTVSEAPEGPAPAGAPKPAPAKPEPAKPESPKPESPKPESAKPPDGTAPPPTTSPKPAPSPGTTPASPAPGGRAGRGGAGR